MKVQEALENAAKSYVYGMADDIKVSDVETAIEEAFIAGGEFMDNNPKTVVMDFINYLNWNYVRNTDNDLGVFYHKLKSVWSPGCMLPDKSVNYTVEDVYEEYLTKK